MPFGTTQNPQSNGHDTLSPPLKVQERSTVHQYAKIELLLAFCNLLIETVTVRLINKLKKYVCWVLQTYSAVSPSNSYF